MQEQCDDAKLNMDSHRKKKNGKVAQSIMSNSDVTIFHISDPGW